MIDVLARDREEIDWDGRSKEGGYAESGVWGIVSSAIAIIFAVPGSNPYYY